MYHPFSYLIVVLSTVCGFRLTWVNVLEDNSASCGAQELRCSRLTETIIPVNQILYIESDNTLRPAADMFCIDSVCLIFR